MRIQIISDGTPGGTRVVDVDTGDELRYVQAIAWECSVRGLATVMLRVKNVPINVVGELDMAHSTFEADDPSELEDAVSIREEEHDLPAPPAADPMEGAEREMQARAR